MANLTKSYETVFVLSNKLTEEATAELVKKFTDLIAANGTIDSVDEWGKRRLAYEIDYEQVSSDYHSALIVLFVAGIGCIIVFILLEMRSPRRPRGPTTHTFVPKGSDRGYRR